MSAPSTEDAARHEAFVGATDVARLLDVRVSWVYENAGRGVIPCYRVGRYVRFRLSEVIHSLKPAQPGEKGR